MLPNCGEGAILGMVTKMQVLLQNAAARYIRRLNGDTRDRIIEALEKLSHEPPMGDIIKLQGRNGYRARTGDHRIIFDFIDNKIHVYKIEPRGQVYKGKGKHK